MSHPVHILVGLNHKADVSSISLLSERRADTQNIRYELNSG